MPWVPVEPFSLCTYTHNRFMASWILSGTTRASRYQKKHSPTHTHRGHQSSLICFVHLLRSIASSLFNPRAWQSFSTISVQVFFDLPLGLAPSTSYSIHSSPNHCLLFATHAHTITTCFAVVPRLCHLIIVSLSTLCYAAQLKLYFGWEIWICICLLCRFCQLVAVVVCLCPTKSSDIRCVPCSSNGDAVVLWQSHISVLHQQCHYGNAVF